MSKEDKHSVESDGPTEEQIQNAYGNHKENYGSDDKATIFGAQREPDPFADPELTTSGQHIVKDGETK